MKNLSVIFKLLIRVPVHLILPPLTHLHKINIFIDRIEKFVS
jgi:hypothetical protein